MDAIQSKFYLGGCSEKRTGGTPAGGKNERFGFVIQRVWGAGFSKALIEYEIAKTARLDVILWKN
jgi:hypothetical protein